LPTTVRDALLILLHSKQRKLDIQWLEYYIQHTLDLGYEMYHYDFDIFQYSPISIQRPADLQPPTQLVCMMGYQNPVGSVDVTTNTTDVKKYTWRT
jgi:hypothetical protein